MYQGIAQKKFRELKSKKSVAILGIETSCDETAAAVVVNGRSLLSNVISSQVELHRSFGGVVPEVASRNHLLAINAVANEALAEAGIKAENLDAIAVTHGAGLAGALLVGVSFAKAAAYALGLPLIKVNHIEAHICANFIGAHEESGATPPFLAVAASGGHTSIIEVLDYHDYRMIGGTVDDAIGEAFDKVARLLGLPYPGGPEIDRLSREGKPVINFYKHNRGIDKRLKLSYSGLKTAVVNYLNTARMRGEEVNVADVCASFTHQAVDLLVETARYAAKERGYDTIVLAGGVAANGYLRERLGEIGQAESFNIFYPPPVLCTDNAAMVASRAYFSILAGEDSAGLDL
ncbi:MAG: tRNA (adenosine(37)-N6)-threonylcarbamoyltransferase complex transferase subunit TsaD, partial [Firmicutes bacterium]|nr:tRNA (adenosine(37)-N6)-threonylcarbamoyltransferase complex transferase subunit TsaD [Bacillota bacterium]